MRCAARARASATCLGITGAREGGLYVSAETSSRRYSYVSVDGPGSASVRSTMGIPIRFERAWATSITCAKI